VTESSSCPSTLVIASGNAGKIREFRRLLAGVAEHVRPQPEGLEVAETGRTFRENARLKAETVARRTGCWVLADDSGLSVDALDGRPGVHSARYAGSDPERIARLLRELDEAGARARAAGLPPSRAARFTAALAVADPGGTIVLEVEGHCPGEITTGPRGSGGFGYDPVFLVTGTGRTFAEMDPDQKRRVGHRGRAFSRLLPELRRLLEPSSRGDHGGSPGAGAEPPAR
jgi:XTP/dITP diphosphohydrolase